MDSKLANLTCTLLPAKTLLEATKQGLLLETTNVLLLTILTLGTILLLRNTRRKRCTNNNNLAVIPGGAGLPLFGHLHKLLIHGTGFIHLFHSWSLRYGDIFKFSLGPWKDVVLINNADMIQKLLSSKEHLGRPPFIYHKIFAHTDFFRYGLAILDVPRWKEHRTILNRAFTYNSLRTYTPILNKFGRELVSDIQKEIDSKKSRSTGTVVQLNKLIHLATIRIVSFVTCGEIIFSPTHIEETLQFHAKDELAKKIVTGLIVKPWLLLPPIWFFHPARMKIEEIKDQVEPYCRKILSHSKPIFRRSLMEKEKKGIFDELDFKNLQKDDNEYDSPPQKFRSLSEVMLDSGEMSDTEICAEVATHILGGHETVSTSLHFLMYNLAVNQHHQRECQREIDDMFAMTFSEEVNMEAFQNLKYLERCIKESLRIYPTFPAFARESTTASLKLTDEYEVDPGVIIMVSPWALHRNEKYYPDPERFDPDRFLPENTQKRNSYSYMPFSAGSRDCIGWKLAMMEMLVVASWILRNFDVYAEPGSPHKLKFHFGLTLVTEPEIKFVLKRRST